MNVEWKTWCRLCGSPNSAFSIEFFPELDKIVQECLKLNLFDEKVCTECLNFLNGVNNFFIKTKIADKMFQELTTTTNSKMKRINEIRLKFGLKELDSELEEDYDDEDNSDMIKQLTSDDNLMENQHEAADINQEIIEEHQMEMESIQLASEEQENYAQAFIKLEDTDEQQFIFENQELLQQSPTPTNSCDIGNEQQVEVVEVHIPNYTEEEGQDIGIDVEDLEATEEWTKEYEEVNGQEIMEIPEDENDNEELDEEEFLLTNYASDSSNILKDIFTKTENEKYFDFNCHICNEEFPKMSQLSNHCRLMHKCVPQVKCMCGKCLGTWKRLLIHKKKHFDEKSEFECNECHISYQKKSTYDTHMLTKHGPNKPVFECQECGKTFKEGKILKNHLKIHLPEDLKKTVTCSICGKKFVNRHCLSKHMNSFHTREFIISCEICGRNFTSKGNLTSHMFTHQSDKNLECDKCDKKFKSYSTLKMHKKSHDGKELECNVCHAKFSIKSCLVNHMVIHSTEKKYKCSFCPNEYKRPQALKCHLSSHTGDRPYKCQFCSRTFVNGSNCRKHKLKDHPLELQEWEQIHGQNKSGPKEPDELKKGSAIIIENQTE